MEGCVKRLIHLHLMVFGIGATIVLGIELFKFISFILRS